MFFFLNNVFFWISIAYFIPPKSHKQNATNHLFSSQIERKQIDKKKNVFFFVNCIIVHVTLTTKQKKLNNNKNRKIEHNRQWKIMNWYLTNLWHLVPMKAAIMLQYSHADGFPYCFTLYSHFLQMVDVLLLL